MRPWTSTVTRLAAAALAAAALPACGTEIAERDWPASFGDAQYWDFADRMQQRLDDVWSEEDGYYKAGAGGVESMVSANLLLVHAVAAMRGHEGPARQDHRARLLARRLLRSPPFVATPPPGGRGSQVHAPGFVNTMTQKGIQHLVFDADVVDGLTYAWRARRELKLPEATAELIRRRLREVAHGSFWRWPAMRLNQVNWYAQIYASAATVTGEPELLRRDLRLQLRRFFSGVARNLGPGMRFHYLPHARASHPMNVDSAEYASIVLSFTRFYQQARDAGMAPLAASHRRLAQEWIKRALAGYWTHGGYLNWDSGLGFERWHELKKLALAQQGLIGIASAPSLQPGPRYGAWAKYLLDRGLELIDRLAVREDGVPDPVRFDLRSTRHQGMGSARLAAARMEANAARAIAAGLGGRRGAEPPPLYAFDPDIGRLAVTTPAYNTAIVAVNQRAFPYGGIELARLYDADQEVAAGIGGQPPASFGVLVRDARGRPVAATQIGRTTVDRRRTPLRLTRAPAGAGVAASTGVGRAFAGAFEDLRATGTVTAGPLRIRSAHRFTRRFIETRWTLLNRSGAGRHSADVLFPSWGRGARAVAVMRDGRKVTVGARIPLTDVAYFHVMSERSGYIVRPRTRPPGATAHLLRTRAQPSAPRPGPTLAIQIARAARTRTASLTVRIVPVNGGR